MAIAKSRQRTIGAYTGAMVIADRTDELAFAKWEHYKKGVDLEAIAWSGEQSGADKHAPANSTAGRMAASAIATLKNPTAAEPHRGLRLIGSYENVARMLDRIAQTPGLSGIMLTFDDFIVGIEQFGQYIQPQMKSRANLSLGRAA